MPRTSADDPARVDEHDPPHDHTACLCDCAAESHEETADHDLPEASGGIARKPGAKKETA